MGHEAWSDDAPAAPEPDPYQPGTAPLGEGRPGPMAYGVDPVAKVKPPAICLIIFGALFGFLSLCGAGQGIAMLAGALPGPQVPPDAPPEVAEMMQQWYTLAPIMNVVTGFMGVVTCVLAFVAGIRLLSMRGATLAKVASVLIMIPVGGCCCLGIPLGIWVLVTLGKPEVAAALREADDYARG
ncbi:MAG: hypothetical protein KDD82_01245 [Planctomycetes bacterium]|nr:hypothetical protein [Planctomycetota bacterium]